MKSPLGQGCAVDCSNDLRFVHGFLVPLPMDRPLLRRLWAWHVTFFGEWYNSKCETVREVTSACPLGLPSFLAHWPAATAATWRSPASLPDDERHVTWLPSLLQTTVDHLLDTRGHLTPSSSQLASQLTTMHEQAQEQPILIHISSSAQPTKDLWAMKKKKATVWSHQVLCGVLYSKD